MTKVWFKRKGKKYRVDPNKHWYVFPGYRINLDDYSNVRKAKRAKELFLRHIKRNPSGCIEFLQSDCEEALYKDQKSSTKLYNPATLEWTSKV